MRVIFTNAFEKDISKIRNSKIAQAIINTIETLKNANSLNQVSGIKKMKGAHNAFRIKINDYRIGFYLEKDTVILSRVLDRKDIYKYFP
jgi:mRNA interferase RelE/StbE